jgi:two-component system, NarL family, response regulator NreC
MSKVITVLSVDDHDITRQGIKSLIHAEEGMVFLGEGATGEEVIPLVEKYKPDVLLLDIQMPQSKNPATGKFQILPTIKVLRRRFPETALIVISMHISHALIESALSSGIGGYLLKSDPLTMMLPAAIRAVSNGGIYFSKNLSGRMQVAEEEGHKSAITKRQKEIMLAIAEQPGLPYVEHARNLGITEGALKNRLSEIYKRLGVDGGMRECLVECVKQGLIVLDD